MTMRALCVLAQCVALPLTLRCGASGGRHRQSAKELDWSRFNGDTWTRATGSPDGGKWHNDERQYYTARPEELCVAGGFPGDRPQGALKTATTPQRGSRPQG
jgi:hypothetical protein